MNNVINSVISEENINSEMIESEIKSDLSNNQEEIKSDLSNNQEEMVQNINNNRKTKKYLQKIRRNHTTIKFKTKYWRLYSCSLC